ncbi:MAG: protease-like activity factor CPAF [Chlamydiales bacterium]
MKRQHLISCILAGAFACTALSTAANESKESLMKKRVLSDLDSIRNIFEVKYAPLRWKYEWANWDLDREVELTKAKIIQLNSPSLKKCQVILKDFFNTAKDYHVGIDYHSTEYASLPFLVKGAEERYFVCYVDRDQVTYNQFPFENGDEILTFDGLPIHEVIQDLRIQEFGLNHLETDQALAEFALTFRDGARGQYVPSGNIEIEGRKKYTNRVIKTTLKWEYNPERVSDFAKLGNIEASQVAAQEWIRDWKSALKKSQFFDRFMISHVWNKSHVGGSLKMNPHDLGARKSFIPRLGRVVWKPWFENIFDVYIFQTSSGKNIGYIRIPHYIGDEEDVEAFGKMMNYFQYRTDALVIDQINNPGGLVFYLYALASTLIEERCSTPQHHIALTQDDVHAALFLLPHLTNIYDDQSAREALGETIFGYPIDYEYATLVRDYCNFIIDQWNQGKLYSNTTHLFGVNEIKPHPYFRYNKPILLLVNSLDFSGGDFFPAILKDNQRVTILGTRTAGAGGCVTGAYFPNHSGINMFQLTETLAERTNNQPIENLGIEPDIHYQVSATDLQENYREYVDKIVEVVEKLVAAN